MLEEVYTERYQRDKGNDGGRDVLAPDEPIPEVHCSFSLIMAARQHNTNDSSPLPTQGANIFDHLPSVHHTRGAASAAVTEIERYLSTGTLKVDNPLQWWTENAELYPNLSRIALDYLSIPGMCN